MDVDAMLASLDSDQRRAVTSTASPLAVVAPAGSGKTRVLTTRVMHRVATGDIEPAHVLCVTFTRKAAGELTDRFRRQGLREHVTAGTFHSIALRQLRDRWAASNRSAPAVLDRIRPFLAEHVQATDAELASLVSEISWARARLITPEHYPDEARRAGRRTRRPADWVAERYGAYEQAKARAHVVDFDDLLAACTNAIHGDPAFAAAQRWRFRHLFVDEFQDVNPLQFALLEAWRGTQWDVFVVGDPHQSIYGWNGADASLLSTLQKRWPALQTIDLDRTHRSTPQITAAAASVVAAAGLPVRHPVSTGDDGPLPRIHAHRDELDEVAVIAGLLRRRHSPGGGWSSMAVLARTQAQITDLERGLRIYGIPCRVRRNAGLLDEPVVSRALNRLARDDRPLPVAFAAALPPDDAVDDLAAIRLTEAIDRHCIDDSRATGRSFANWARTGLAEFDGTAVDAVILSTIHGAKGLEWTVVHIAGVEDGSIPFHSARRREARDEEARLLYVAMTRAERELEVHWVRTRTVAGRRRERQRSPFLDGFEDAIAALPVDEPTSGREHIAALRAALPVRRPVDPLVTSLQAWRTRRARAARTVPDSVLHDETIVHIAERRPVTIEQLSTVEGMGVARITRFGDEIIELVSRSVAPLRPRERHADVEVTT